jgi:hypothetical protein
MKLIYVLEVHISNRDLRASIWTLPEYWLIKGYLLICDSSNDTASSADQLYNIDKGRLKFMVISKQLGVWVTSQFQEMTAVPLVTESASDCGLDCRIWTETRDVSSNSWPRLPPRPLPAAVKVASAPSSLFTIASTAQMNTLHLV